MTFLINHPTPRRTWNVKSSLREHGPRPDPRPLHFYSPCVEDEVLSKFLTALSTTPPRVPLVSLWVGSPTPSPPGTRVKTPFHCGFLNRDSSSVSLLRWTSVEVPRRQGQQLQRPYTQILVFVFSFR